ncbi:hypothetical protein P0W64_20125 [Tsukamurella sp. 8F]|uniref:hypothetical protein n=1 Tax=unclassified Tsukamurella TaxID=2633480 RepID=UPI0023B8A0B3|nr:MULTISPECIES: hypothetical protein [unclassified Tsukamurella]MDF0531829.1 hypothetical protein [Tsukamurella sp. 8J]MDF0589093.1 hypothetical protein [Tsukamurella sp. 8F]
MAATALGATSDSGRVLCTLVAVDGDEIVSRESRTIDRGAFPSIGPADKISSGFDLLESYSESPVDGVGIAYRTRWELLALRLRSSGTRRTASVVRDVDAVMRCLGETGEIARFGSVLLLDAGSTRVRAHLVDVESGEVRWKGGFPRPVDGDLPARLRALLTAVPAEPGAVVPFGIGGALPAVVDAAGDVLWDKDSELVVPEEPEALAAVGAAYVALDVAGVTAASPGSRRGIATLGGYGARVAALMLPVLVVIGLLGAGLVATIAAGGIGSTGDGGEALPAVRSTPTATAPAAQGPSVATPASDTTSADPSTGVDVVGPPQPAAPPPVITTETGDEPAMTIFATPTTVENRPVAPRSTTRKPPTSIPHSTSAPTSAAGSTSQPPSGSSEPPLTTPSPPGSSGASAAESSSGGSESASESPTSGAEPRNANGPNRRPAAGPAPTTSSTEGAPPPPVGLAPR